MWKGIFYCRTQINCELKLKERLHMRVVEPIVNKSETIGNLRTARDCGRWRLVKLDLCFYR